MQYIYRDTVDKFLSIEQKYNLLSYKIGEVYFWQISRINIYLAIMSRIIENNSFETVSPLHKKKIFHRIFINCLLFNPFFSKDADILVFDSGRLYKEKDHYIDIYTHYLCDRLNNEKVKYIKYETNYNNDDKLKNRSLENKHTDFITLAAKILTIFKNYKPTREEKEFLLFIEKEINECFNIKIDILKIVVPDINVFKSQYPFYYQLFKKTKPKDIFMVNAGLKPYIVAAAKKQNIRVNELQHGLISNYDIINHFPNSKADSLAYYPTRFFKWNNVDMCHSVLPLSENNIVSFNNEHLKRCLENNSHVKKVKNTILIVSQPVGSLNIFSFIKRNLSSLKEYEIIYKIHPAENKTILKEFKNKIEKEYSNISFIDNECSIYSLMKKSEYILGVFSSALFEAQLFDCKIILLNIDGVEMSLPLLIKGNARLVNMNERLIKILSV